ncbi:Gx transporter family protein [[Clostridium] polysaccharolyticum]|uniref:Heptaprenyl diphosphate synthase n=1 Tax=[Clostridium] polysaccharolyticum TaxID=29364 RepID=A0A1I0BVI5_9FIRM|nr:Gx transporter family protein [[Clostridium] polysaccharolyticum]SET10487.1 heptaprenyl diphosphate synthase [[Clostridium] polysaccharolyticum]
MRNRKIALMGLLVSLAFLLSYLESMLPIQIGIPGVKLGLANIVILFAVVQLGTKDAFFVMAARTVLAAFTFGNLYSLAYSLSGGILSTIIMCFMNKTKKTGIIGISAAGGVAHNIGQLIIASYVLKSLDLKYYAGFLILCGVFTGVLTGIVCRNVNEKIRLV